MTVPALTTLTSAVYDTQPLVLLLQKDIKRMSTSISLVIGAYLLLHQFATIRSGTPELWKHLASPMSF